MWAVFFTLYWALTLGYTGFRFVKPFPANGETRVLLMLALSLGVMSWPIEFWLQNHGWMNRFSHAVLSVCGLLAWFLLFATLVWDVARLLRRSSDFLPYLLLGTGVVLSCYAYMKAMAQPDVNRIDITADQWPVDAKPLKIAHLSDLHIGSGFTGKWLKGVVEKTNAERPDIVVISGDLIDGKPAALEKELAVLKDLAAPVYVISGNHEFYYGKQQWDEAFKRLGMTVLNNRSVPIADGKAYLGGVEAIHGRAVSAQAVRSAFAAVPEGAPKILLAHYPEVFDRADGVLLTLSGHTHGGHLFPVSVLVRRSNAGYDKGFYQKDGRFMNLSQGTGMWGGFAARIGTNNEISILTLKGKADVAE